VNQDISVDPDVVRSAMNRISNVSGLVERGHADLPPAAVQCVAVPEVAARFQSAFELAIEKISSVAVQTQRQLAGNAQNLWGAAEELGAVDAEVAEALAKTEAAALALEPAPVPPVSTDPVTVPNANSIGGTPVTSPQFSVGPVVSETAPSVGDTGGVR